MNVNLWGPELWSLLHGVAALVSSADFAQAAVIFKSLRVLLPCVHCRNSYVQFLADTNVSQEIRAGGAVELVYRIHCDVDNKLESQRLEALLAAVSAPDEVAAKIRAASATLSGRPSLQVVRKRWELSEGKPFAESSVWRVLFAFVMLVDTDDDPVARRAALRDWTDSLGRLMLSTLEYAALGAKLMTLVKVLQRGLAYSTRDGFALVALAREGRLPQLASLSLIDVREAKRAERAWLKPLWHAYKHNLPAGACGKFTCA